MRILEILLPKSVKDKDISPKHVERIDLLQKRMDRYVDKIGDSATSAKGREFLKAKLKDDYDELRNVIKDAVAEQVSEHIIKKGSGYRLVSHKGKNLGDFKSKKAAAKHEGEVEYFKKHPKESVNENGLPPVEPIQPVDAFEIVDSKTGKVMGKPYSSRSRARARVDRLDNEYGAYRYKVRRVGSTLYTEPPLNEAVHKLPLTEEDFELVRTLMSRPIPAVIAPIYIQEIIDDDEFNGMLNEFADTNPGMDIRPHVVDWIKRIMPDQMYRFDHSGATMKQKLGQTSVIHGYDPEQYHGSNDPITGNAYGRS